MLITSLLGGGIDDFGFDDENYKGTSSAADLKERLRKTLRYGRNPAFDRTSLPLTELAVELLQDAAPRPLGKLDMHWASRISRRATVSPCAMILGLIYIERLRNKNPDYLQTISSSDLFLISMMMASKYLYDEGVTEEVFNDEWAESADMDVDELNEIEREFLGAIDWSLYVHAENFWAALDQVEQRIAWRMCQEHGVLTYLDLDLLSQGLQWRSNVMDLITLLSKVLTICTVAYAAGTSTMLASPSALDLSHNLVNDMASTSNLPQLPVDLSAWLKVPESAVMPNITSPGAPHIDFLQESSSMSYAGVDTLSASSPVVAADDEIIQEDNQTRSSLPDPSTPLRRTQKRKVPGCLGLAGLLTLSVLSKSVMGAATPDDTNTWLSLDQDETDSTLDVVPCSDLLMRSDRVMLPENIMPQGLESWTSRTRYKACKKCQQRKSTGNDKQNILGLDSELELASDDWRQVRGVDDIASDTTNSDSEMFDTMVNQGPYMIGLDNKDDDNKVVKSAQWLRGQGHMQWLSRYWLLPSTYCS